MRLQREGLIRIGKLSLPAVAVLLTVLGIASLAGRDEAGQDTYELLGRYFATMDPPEQPAGAKDKKGDSPADKQLARVTKRHVFSPSPPGKKPPKLVGVLGDKAFFSGGSGHEVGQSYQGAKIKDIGPDWVKIEFDGKPKTLYVYGPPHGGSGPGPGTPAGPPGILMRGMGPLPPGAGASPEMLKMMRMKALRPPSRGR